MYVFIISCIVRCIIPVYACSTLTYIILCTYRDGLAANPSSSVTCVLVQVTCTTFPELQHSNTVHQTTKKSNYNVCDICTYHYVY